MTDIHLGALLAVSLTLLVLVCLLVVVLGRLYFWAARHRKLFVERTEEGEIRFGGELRAPEIVIQVIEEPKHEG